MSKGIPLTNPLKTERLIHWFYEVKKEELLRTVLLVEAMNGADGQRLNTLLNDYRQCIFPTEESNKELAERYAEFLEENDVDYFRVRSVEPLA